MTGLGELEHVLVPAGAGVQDVDLAQAVSGVPHAGRRGRHIGSTRSVRTGNRRWRCQIRARREHPAQADQVALDRPDQDLRLRAHAEVEEHRHRMPVGGGAVGADLGRAEEQQHRQLFVVGGRQGDPGELGHPDVERRLVVGPQRRRDQPSVAVAHGDPCTPHLDHSHIPPGQPRTSLDPTEGLSPR
ncbi:hypothetical protein [Nocardia asteroides]